MLSFRGMGIYYTLADSSYIEQGWKLVPIYSGFYSRGDILQVR